MYSFALKLTSNSSSIVDMNLTYTFTEFDRLVLSIFPPLRIVHYKIQPLLNAIAIIFDLSKILRAETAQLRKGWKIMKAAMWEKEKGNKSEWRDLARRLRKKPEVERYII